ncbi:hypothetical protein PC116_g33114 [Phytophthora cactorum]|nr:hypothetical protein PC116_g33114 [Phytophthora cactorum]
MLRQGMYLRGIYLDDKRLLFRAIKPQRIPVHERVMQHAARRVQEPTIKARRPGGQTSAEGRTRRVIPMPNASAPGLLADGLRDKAVQEPGRVRPGEADQAAGGKQRIAGWRRRSNRSSSTSGSDSGSSISSIGSSSSSICAT